MTKHSRKKKRNKKAATPEATVLQRETNRSATALELETEELTANLEGYDAGSLSQAKTYWFFGEWDKLAALDIQSLQHHPDRDRFAILVASAHQQLGDHDETRKYTRMALNWGCPQDLVAKILVAGVHNTLGRASAIIQDNERITQHFRESVRLATDNSNETDLMSHSRSVREMARIGLLPQAATLLDEELQKIQHPQYRPQQQQARINILETETTLLHHELSLAQQRQQLYQSKTNVKIIRTDSNEPPKPIGIEKRAVSQLGQDLWVLDKTNYKRGGFFVEFGATDGVLLSNTFLLEKEFDWKGICAEPNPKLFSQLKDNRNCIVTDSCIGAKTGGHVEFLLADVYSGMTKHALNDNNATRRADYFYQEKYKIILETISLNDFLLKNNAPKLIDFISIDTEGSEYEILETFPFNNWDIKLFTIEHNFGKQREKIRALLQENGYSFIRRDWDDWYYIL